MKRTKIIVTVGPSIEKYETIQKLITLGVDAFRFNFSHSNLEWHKKMLEIIREIADKKNKIVTTIMDLSGPKIRIGNLKKPIQVKTGDIINLYYGDFIGKGNIIPLNVKEVFDSIKKGDIFYIADGTVKLKVLKNNENEISAKVLSSGVISSKKGLNFPKISLNIPALTEKDKQDLKFGIEQEFDIIALSFVKNEQDIIDAKNILKQYNSDIPIIAKIEKNEAVKNIDKILNIADGVMIARGDLGIEIDMEKVPLVQKMIIKKANNQSKPVITATQMLTSMINHIKPTRAEVSDIANAVLDGTDAVMLSDETTVGKFPIESVKVMIKTIKQAEKIYPYYYYYGINKNINIYNAIAETAARLSDELKTDGIVVFTKTGASARRIVKNKPKCKILAISPEEKILRRLNISWGVTPYMKSKETTNADELLVDFLKKSEKEFGRDNIFIVTIGYPAGIPNSTNVIRTIRKQDYEYFLN